MGKQSKDLGRANERNLVDKLHKAGVPDAKRRPLSGAIAELPGDVTANSIRTLFEAKVYTTFEVDGARYIRIDLNWLDKIRREAATAGFEYGVVAFRGKQLHTQYILMNLEDFVKIAQESQCIQADS